MDEVKQGIIADVEAELVGHFAREQHLGARCRVGERRKLAGYQILAHRRLAIFLVQPFEHHAQHLVGSFDNGRFDGVGLGVGHLRVAVQLPHEAGAADGRYFERVVGVVARNLQMRPEREDFTLNFVAEPLQNGERYNHHGQPHRDADDGNFRDRRREGTGIGPAVNFVGYVAGDVH